MNPFYLDLWQEELYDWERLKSKRIIDSLLKGIEMGDVFEPVFVWKIAHWDTNYCLDKEKIDPLHPEWRDVENPFSSCFGIPCLDIEGKLRKDQRYRQ